MPRFATVDASECNSLLQYATPRRQVAPTSNDLARFGATECNSLQRFATVFEKRARRETGVWVSGHESRVASRGLPDTFRQSTPPRTATRRNPTLSDSRRRCGVSGLWFRVAGRTMRDCSEFRGDIEKTAIRTLRTRARRRKTKGGPAARHFPTVDGGTGVAGALCGNVGNGISTGWVSRGGPSFG